MKHSYLSLFIAAATAASCLVPAVYGDTLDQKTIITFGGPVEIPGMVLPAGTYVMKRLDPASSQNVVQFYNRDENHMYAMILANKAYRPYRVDHTVITWEERAAGSPPAMKEWFFPDSSWGEAFVYPKVKTVALAENTPPPPPPPAVTPAPAPEPTPAPAPQAEVQPQPEQQPAPEIAQNEPAPAPQAVPEQPAPQEPPQELPKTASNLPLAGLLGLFLVAAGAMLRRRVTSGI